MSSCNIKILTTAFTIVVLFNIANGATESEKPQVNKKRKFNLFTVFTKIKSFMK